MQKVGGELGADFFFQDGCFHSCRELLFESDPDPRVRKTLSFILRTVTCLGNMLLVHINLILSRYYQGIKGSFLRRACMLVWRPGRESLTTSRFLTVTGVRAESEFLYYVQFSFRFLYKL